VTEPASITADCAAIAYLLKPTSDDFIDDVPVLRTKVLGDVSDIAVVSPEIFGGQTTAG
jgi:hypothetical protein